MVDDIDSRFHAGGDGLDSGLDDGDFFDNFLNFDLDWSQTNFNSGDALVALLAHDFVASLWLWWWALRCAWSGHFLGVLLLGMSRGQADCDCNYEESFECDFVPEIITSLDTLSLDQTINKLYIFSFAI